jgi:radical SAM protein with 4Fe4S-binding SPASM domain
MSVIDQLTEFPDPPMLVLTGGDPLKRSDIFALIEYAASSLLDVSITPSATPLVTREAIRRFRRSGVCRLAISIDGADAQTHDAIRGVTRSFERSLRILADAREEGIPTQVNTTITPFNVPQIDRLADLLAQQDIIMWSVFFLVPLGRAAAAPRLSAGQYEEAFARLWQQSQRQPYAIKTTEAPHYRRFVLQQQQSHYRSSDHAAWLSRFAGINDGNGVMFVSHTGMIYPSGFLPIVCGIFPLDNLVHVYQHSPIFQKLRDADCLQGKCRECEYRRICGGSRARAYAVTGNPLAAEPDCSYIPAALS